MKIVTCCHECLLFKCCEGKNGHVRRDLPKVPPNDITDTKVLVLLPALEDAVLKAAHDNTGQDSWEVMYRLMQSRCYFPSMASKCMEYVRGCGPCRAASTKSGPVALPSRPVIANGS